MDFDGVYEFDNIEFGGGNHPGVQQCHETTISNILNKMEELIARVDKETKNYFLNMEEIFRQFNTNFQTIQH